MNHATPPACLGLRAAPPGNQKMYTRFAPGHPMIQVITPRRTAAAMHARWDLRSRRRQTSSAALKHNPVSLRHSASLIRSLRSSGKTCVLSACDWPSACLKPIKESRSKAGYDLTTTAQRGPKFVILQCDKLFNPDRSQQY